MNYQRIRVAAKKKLEAKKAQLAAMNGEDRTKLETHLVDEATKEELALIKKENEDLKNQIKQSDDAALELLQKNEDLEKSAEELKNKNAELETILNQPKVGSGLEEGEEIVETSTDKVVTVEQAAADVGVTLTEEKKPEVEIKAPAPQQNLHRQQNTNSHKKR